MCWSSSNLATGSERRVGVVVRVGVEGEGELRVGVKWG